jgi:hippurate hydrolase
MDKPRLNDWFSSHAERAVRVYRWLHQHPEVSLAEQETAKHLGEIWNEFGYTVTYNVGGFGLVGVLENGDGPTIMIRTDLDALPVTEETGLPFASTAQVVSPSGAASGVMHACGHDIHMTTVTMVAGFLAENQDAWSGKMIVIGQPAEELGEGAIAMLDDDLYKRFGKPDYALALHVESATAAGQVSVRPGYVLANVDSVDITVHGRGGHGAAPETTIDPIAQAAQLITNLQTIVSREVKPIESAVVTVGSIHGGTKHNIIPDSCHLQLTVRSYSPVIRQKVLDAIERKAKGVAMSFDAPEPTIKISQGTPSLENNAEMAGLMAKVFADVIGAENVLEGEPVMGGEDFSQFGLAGVPIVMYRLGVIEPRRLKQLNMSPGGPPSLHSAKFYPDLDGTLETGFLTMAAGVLELFQQ